MTADSPYRVMVVDDSAVIRGLLTRSLESDPAVSVVASIANGEQAIKAVTRYDVEVVVLDIEMPVMDGLTALPKIIAAKRGVQVIMASTLTRKNAEISLRALQAGAADYVTKPTSGGDLNSADEFKRELTQKVKGLGAAARGSTTPASRATATTVAPGRASAPPRTATKFTLRKAPIMPPAAIAIGSSTGGPQALLKVLGDLGGDLNRPIYITQHMPATFTTLLAEHITRSTSVTCGEAQDGDTVSADRAYIAPGDYHMEVVAGDSAPVIRLNQNAPENFCRPAVDPMLRSLARIYGSRLLVVILTGMGADGAKGSKDVTEAGGTVIAQDEATSVVWGMPGAVATAGLCSEVMPIDDIAPYIRKLLMRSAA